MKSYPHIWIVFLLLFSIHTQPHAQPSHYSAALTAGRVIPVNGSRYQQFTPTIGIDMAAWWQTDTNAYWKKYWHQPSFGVRAAYAHIANSIVGERIELAGALDFQLWKQLHFTYSLGFSFFTNPNQRSHLDENIFIGSYLNCLINCGLTYYFPFSHSSNPSAFVALKIVHASNGYLYKPNHGLNFVQAELGYKFPSHHKPTGNNLVQPDTEPQFERSTRPFISIAPGAVMRREDDIGSFDYVYKYYFAYTLQAGIIRHVHPCYSYGASFDVSYNFSHTITAPDHQWPAYPALSAFGEIHWGNLSLRLAGAHYLGYYKQNWEQYYERVGLYYNITSTQRIGVAMKLHYDHIDFIEWTYHIEL
ncbi:MAG: acyloxyacyl hydrolase [Bacteroidales bacterium]|nr:acyloxyacyl hydrolase [Candidatus Colimorpha onthohippi]